MTAPLMFEGFYQLGYVCRDVRSAAKAMAERYGMARFRYTSRPSMEQAHAYVGPIMIELIQPTADSSPIYTAYMPDDPAAIRLHHHGFLIRSEESWNAINAEVDRRGIATDARGEVMDGNLRFLYADTRADLGHYSEYVFLAGPALSMYDDVPRNP